MNSIADIIGSWGIWSSENKLWQLLQAKVINEAAILACIDAHPEYCSSSREDDDMYPIHVALDKSLSIDVIRRMLSCYPQACTTQDTYGRILLHEVLREHKLTDLAVLAIDACDDSVRCADNDGYLPLHVECFHHCRYAIIIKLLAIYPTSIQTANSDDLLPLHLALRSRDSQPDVVFHLISLYPDAVSMDVNGCFALHDECMNKCRYDVIVKLLEVHPDALRTPYQNNLPLHEALKHSYMYLQSDTILHLINLYPEAVKIVDKDGKLPLHIISSSATKFYVIPMLLAIYPDAVRIPDKDTALPFQRIFDTYYRAMSRYDAKHNYLSNRQYRDVVLKVLDMYHRPFKVDVKAAYNNKSKKFRWLINLIYEYTPDDKLPSDYESCYHDMNWEARYPLLYLLLQLQLPSSSTSSNNNNSNSTQQYHNHISSFHHVDGINNKANVISCRLLSCMIAAAGRMSCEEDGSLVTRYDMMKGNDLGCVLLRYVVKYL